MFRSSILWVSTPLHSNPAPPPPHGASYSWFEIEHIWTSLESSQSFRKILHWTQSLPDAVQIASVSQINYAFWIHLKGDLVTVEDILIVKQVKWWNREGRIRHNAKLGWKYERMQCELEVCHEQEKIFPPNYQKSLFLISFKSTPSQSGIVPNHENLALLSSPTWPLHVMVKISHGSNPDRIL